ncbi:MAG TPA: hypothetical protein VGO84_08900, partial [Burkholderiales bacterium]|nr:hypothetical protein [Burkholderiales bacterium]
MRTLILLRKIHLLSSRARLRVIWRIAKPRGMSSGAPLTLYNSLTRSLERFEPIDPANVRVYSCGPTVYNYAHIGNLRAYVFTDTL